MKQEITIRRAELKDAELITELGRETFHDAFVNHPLMPAEDLKVYLDETFTISRVSAELAEPNAIFLLAEIDDEAVGYAKLERNNETTMVTAQNPIKLKRLYAKQKFIGFGIGARLMESCLAEAEKLDHDKIWLTVWENNLHAQNFYQKWKFEICGTINFQLGKSLLTDFLMQREILVSRSFSAV
ncbi:MAG: GNAT family N-acetyltransferase [Pyrinomonadaceae bacterium]|nr:GNAT family N-acetyltransferase [Pyrinomonadaceae bacterium]